MISTSIVLPRVAPSPRFFRRVSSAVGAQSVLEVLTSRGLVHDVSSRPELSAALARPPLTFYIGLDPTANSLHVGHLLPVVVARHLQRAGHRPIMVIGGATGRIGDPTGRSLERQLLDLSETDANASRLEKLAAHLLRLPPDGPPNLLPALVVNNLSWFSSINALDFLRDVGGHFRVSKMLARDSVKKRLESATDGGLSFLELSYQLFQVGLSEPECACLRSAHTPHHRTDRPTTLSICIEHMDARCKLAVVINGEILWLALSCFRAWLPAAAALAPTDATA
jgi:hypothetical protein